MLFSFHFVQKTLMFVRDGRDQDLVAEWSCFRMVSQSSTRVPQKERMNHVFVYRQAAFLLTWFLLVAFELSLPCSPSMWFGKRSLNECQTLRFWGPVAAPFVQSLGVFCSSQKTLLYTCHPSVDKAADLQRNLFRSPSTLPQYVVFCCFLAVSSQVVIGGSLM